MYCLRFYRFVRLSLFSFRIVHAYLLKYLLILTKLYDFDFNVGRFGSTRVRFISKTV